MGPFLFLAVHLSNARGNALHRTKDSPRFNTLHCEVNGGAIAALLVAARRPRWHDRGR
jgi:hypothetical protein